MSGRRLERGAPYLALAGALCLCFSLAVWLAAQRLSLWVEIPLALGVSLLAAFVLWQPALARQALTGRRGRGGHVLLMSLALLILLVALNVLASRRHVRLDLTAGGLYSLSPQTRQVLAGLTEPVKLTGFFSASDPQQAQTQARLADLLAEYRFYSAKIRFEFVDPERKPALAKQYGVTRAGAIVLERGIKRQETLADDEAGLTAAIAKIGRDRETTVYFVTGHRERDPNSLADDGYGQMKISLMRNAYRVQTLDLTVISDVAPLEGAVLIIAGAQTPFGEVERGWLRAYLTAGGRALLACDPGQPTPDATLLAEWGLRVRDDLIIDPASAFFGDMAAPAIRRYPAHAITAEMDGKTSFFPYARSLEILTPAPTPLHATPLALSSEESWGETRLQGRQAVALNPGEDTPGPLVIAVAVQAANGGRLVVFGSSLFVANGVLASARGASGNRELFLNAVGWLAEADTPLVGSIKALPARVVHLTRPQMNVILYSSVVLLPLAVLALGFAAWWARSQ